MCKFDKPKLYIFIQVTNKNIEQSWDNFVEPWQPLVIPSGWHEPQIDSFWT